MTCPAFPTPPECVRTPDIDPIPCGVKVTIQCPDDVVIELSDGTKVSEKEFTCEPPEEEPEDPDKPRRRKPKPPNLDGPPPQTKPRCPNVMPPANGQIDTPRSARPPYIPPESIAFTCNPCFKLVAADGSTSDTITCQENGRFEKDPPTCVSVECTQLSNPVNGRVIQSSSSCNAVATYQCNECFSLSGSSTRSCEAQGWSGTAPTCIALTCPGIPSNPVGGTVSSRSNTCGTTVSYSCNGQCATLIGSPTRTCLPSGQWDNPTEPTCQSVQCLPFPTDIPNGQVTPKANTCETTLTYSCTDPCAELVGQATRTCLSTGQWSPQNPPSCQITSCPFISIANAQVSSTNTRCGTTVTVTCNPGFELSGQSQVTCRKIGNQPAAWSPGLPTCGQSNCNPPPQVPQNGAISTTGSSVGTVVTYTCNECYERVGTPTRRCVAQFNGPQWDVPQEPTCQIIQCEQLNLPNGQVFGTQACGQSVQFQCNFGFRRIGATSATCVPNNQGGADWSNPVPSCQRRCPFMGNGVQSTKDPTSPRPDPSDNTYSPGDRLVFVCPDCFEIVPDNPNSPGDPDRLCQQDGTWDNPIPPDCRPVTCPPLGSTNANPSTADNTCGQTVQYGCDSPCQELDGPDQRTCLQSGQWSTPNEPRCQTISCEPRPNNIANGRASTTDQTCQTIVTYSCDECYTLRGAPQRICNPDKQWQPAQEPFCESLTCAPLTIPNGVARGTNECNSFVTIDCNPGFVRQGTSSLRCAPVPGDPTRVRYEGAPATCGRVRCPYPMPDDPNVEIVPGSATPDSSNTFAPNEQVNFRCRECFTLDPGNGANPDTVTCLSTGIVDKPPPTCSPVTCPQLSDPSPGSVFTPNNNCGSQARYSCPRCFSLDGPSVRECGENGQWTPFQEPVCLPLRCDTLSLQNGQVSGSPNCDSTVTITCNQGFELNGDRSLTCQPVPGDPSRVAYDRPLPSCGRVRCPYPMPNDPNSEIVENISADRDPIDNTFGPNEFVVFRCKECFSIVPDSNGVEQDTVTCLPSGNVDRQPPFCQSVTCSPRPTTPNQGSVSSTDNTCNTVVTYDCNNCYRLTGPNSRTCLPSGQWSQLQEPVCTQLRCDELSVANGIVSGSPNCNSQVTIECNQGFTRSGPSTKRCVPDPNDPTRAIYEPQQPTVCSQIRCPYPMPTDPNSEVVPGSAIPDFDDTIGPGDTVRYRCLGCYEISPDPITGSPEDSVTCQQDGSLLGSPPSCQLKRCEPAPSDPSPGTVSPKDNTCGTAVRYSCPRCYQLEGQSTRVCLPSGQWSDPAEPTCQRLECRTFTVANGQVSGSKSCDNSVTVTCDPGFTIQGPATLACVPVGSDRAEYSGPQPTCGQVRCPYPMPNIDSFIVEDESARRAATFGPGEQVVFKCRECYSIRPDSSGNQEDTVFCQENGETLGSPPRCDKLSCSELPAPLNGRRFPSVGNNECGDRFFFQCNSGFEPKGSKINTVICVDTGRGDAQWNNDPLTCSARCNYRFPPSNGDFADDSADPSPSDNRYSPGDVVKFKCNPCYELVGQDTSNCQADGSYDTRIPECERLVCPPLSEAPGLTISSQSRLCGRTVSFDCQDGFRKVGGVATAECRETFPGSGQAQWSGQPPTCTRIECPDPMTPLNGAVDRSPGATSAKPYTPGDMVTFVCNDCYKIAVGPGGIPDDEIMCLESGTWDAPSPTCERVTCSPAPSNPRNGRVDSTSTDCEATVTYSCDTCYRLVGDQSRTCSNNGIWTPTREPTCQIKTCTDVSSVLPPNVIILNQDNNCGGKIEFACNQEFSLNGAASLDCLEESSGDGATWSGSLPTCSQNTCPNPMPAQLRRGNIPAVLVGSQSDSAPFTPSESLFFRCDDPCYQLSENRDGDRNPRITCLSSLMFDYPQQQCEPVKCSPTPINPPNGRVDSTNDECRSVVTYSCNDCYRLQGTNSKVCTPNGIWDPSEGTTCILKQCPALTPPQNGFIVVPKTDCGQEVQFRCDDGYTLQGRDRLTCQNGIGDSAAWNVQPPTCQLEICKNPMPSTLRPGNQEAVLDEGPSAQSPYTEGAILLFKCTDPCFRILSPENTEGQRRPDINCESDLEFNAPEPQCEPISCSPAPFNPPNGQVDFTDSACDTTVRYTCNSCYALSGAPTRTCRPDGFWDPFPVPSCILKQCEPLVAPLNGRILSLNSACGTEVQFACNQFYSLRGSSVLTCQDSGPNSAEWSGDIPRCEQNTCENPMPANLRPGNVKAVLDVDNSPSPPYLSGATLLYKCEDRCFKIAEDNTGNDSPIITCQNNLEFDRPEPQCERITCSPPPSNPANGAVDSTSAECGKPIEYNCNECYRLTGAPFRACTFQGMWMPTNVPTCQLKKCRELPDIDNGDILFRTTDCGNEVKYVCEPLFSLVGSDTLRCVDSGGRGAVWDNEPPSCEQQSCPNPMPPILRPGNRRAIPALDGSNLDEPPYIPGTTLVYKCDDECFQIAENSNGERRPDITCQNDLSFSDRIPQCEPKGCRPAPVNPTNGAVSSTDTACGTTVDYSCDSCYRLQGPSSRACESNLWTPPFIPTCEQLTCRQLRAPENGRFSPNSNVCDPNRRVTFTCTDGFSLVGNRVLTCSDVGGTAAWSGNEPTCQMNVCSEPMPPSPIPPGTKDPFIDPSNSDPPPYTPGEEVTYACPNCYDISRNARGQRDPTIECLNSMVFDDKIPRCEKKTCRGAIIAPENGAVSNTDNTCGNSVVYTCDQCYTLSDPTAASRACTPTGWVPQNQPTCRRVTCEDLTSPANGEIIEENRDCQGRARFRCSSGYRISGSDTLICQPNGRWNAPRPACAFDECPFILPPVNGGFTSDSDTPPYSLGSEVSLECDPCYKIQRGPPGSGKDKVQCTTSGWDGELNSCERLKCERFSGIMSGVITGQNELCGDFAPGEGTVTFLCNSGFEIDGAPTLKCIDRNGEAAWDKPKPTCVPKTCPGIQPPDNGGFNPIGSSIPPYTAGDTVAFICNQCYKLTPNLNSIKCETSGDWNRDVPQCIGPSECQGLPSNPRNGEVDLRDKRCGTTVTYSCNTCYSLQGDEERECTVNGWRPQAEPSCKLLQCADDLPVPENGVILEENNDCDKSVRFGCKPGFNLQGPSTVTCQQDGPNSANWQGPFPTCTSNVCTFDIETEGVIENGEIDLNPAKTDEPPYVPGSKITWKCAPCYEIARGRDDKTIPTITCTDKFKWDRPVPRCTIKRCFPSPASPANGVSSSVDNKCGTKVFYTCNDCYKPDDISLTIRQCSEDGWRPKQAPICVEISCEELPPPNFGRIVRQNKACRGTVEFACDEGYTLNGENNIRCISVGGFAFWEFDPPICSKSTCPDPMNSPPENGFIVSEDSSPPPYQVNDIIAYSCRPCYIIARNADNERDGDIQCTDAKVWDSPTPTCELLKCPKLTAPENGAIVQEDRDCDGTVGASFTCDDGFELIGPQQILCVSEGNGAKWNDNPPTCGATACGLPPDIENGQIDPRGTSPPPFTEGDIVKYRCDACYYIKPAADGTKREESMCLANGNWETPPICTLLSCPQVSAPRNGGRTPKRNNNECGKFITFKCNDGFEPGGNKVSRINCIRKSEDKADWDNVPQTCVPG
ncbi:unnamed protein product, partial [Owenia fusiformis]